MDDTIWGEQDVRAVLLNLFDRGVYELGLDYLLFSTRGALDHLHPFAIEMVLEKLADQGGGSSRTATGTSSTKDEYESLQGLH